MSDIFIGRQPIYDRKMSVYAYELLFRSASENSANIVDGDQATSDVIVNTFMEIGLDKIVSDRLAFINLTRSFFVDETTISLPKDRVVLELGEGRYRSVPVRIGRRGQRMQEVLTGLSQGDRVVTSAQFLIDSESSKQADLARMGDEAESAVQSARVMGQVDKLDAPRRLVTISRRLLATWFD